MVEILVILDGASEPVGGGRPPAPIGGTPSDGAHTSLDRARTPALAALCAAGTLSRVRTVPRGLAAGSEVAIPTLLGWAPHAAVDRGAVEAAAHGIAVGDGECARRVDVLVRDGARAGADVVAASRAALAAALPPGCAVHALVGHRLLVTGPCDVVGPLGPTTQQGPSGARLAWWDGGIVPPPHVLDATTTVIAARGAAAGVARLLGAQVVIPRGATGDVDTDLRAKLAAVEDALRPASPLAHGGALLAPSGAGDVVAGRVVLHVGGADEAAHRRDRAAKVAFVERVDGELLAPLAVLAEQFGAALTVCPDHGCDPATGAHDDAPVPSVRVEPGEWQRTPRNTWSSQPDAPARPDRQRTPPHTWSSLPDAAARPAARLTERAVAHLPVTDLTRTLQEAAA